MVLLMSSLILKFQPMMIIVQIVKQMKLVVMNYELDLVKRILAGRTVHGGWTDWADWAGCDCDYNTGTATWTRTRTCTNPAPYCHGNSCTGESSQVDSCVEQCKNFHGCLEISVD